MLITIPSKDFDLLCDIVEEYAVYCNEDPTNAPKFISALYDNDIVFVDLNDSSIDAFAVFRVSDYVPNPDKLAVQELLMYKSSRSKIPNLLKAVEGQLKDFGYEVILVSFTSDNKINLKDRLYRMAGFKEFTRTFIKEIA